MNDSWPGNCSKPVPMHLKLVERSFGEAVVVSRAMVAVELKFLSVPNGDAFAMKPPR